MTQCNDNVSFRHVNACATVEFLERETPKFISPLLWPPNSPDLNPVDYSVWSILQEKVYKHASLISTTSYIASESETSGPSYITSSLKQLCVTGVTIFQLVSRLCVSFRALVLILTLCFCNNSGLRSFCSIVESNS